MKQNKKGQMGMSFLVGIMVMIMSLVFFMALTPVITKMFGISKGADGSNCQGYIDPDATALNNQSYNSARNSDTVACAILDFGPALLILSVIFGLVAGIITGKLGQTEQQPNPYAQGY